MFFEIWNGNEKPKKKISEKWVWKGQVLQPNRTSLDKLDYVGQVGQGEGGFQILVGQVGQGQGVGSLEPFHLSQMGLQGRGMVRCKTLRKKMAELRWVLGY